MSAGGATGRRATVERLTTLVAPATLLVAVVLAGAPASADHNVEVSLGAGFHRLDPGQDLGDYAQLANVRSGVLGTTLAAFDGRLSYCFGDTLCFGPWLGAHVGSVGGRAATLLSYRGEVSLQLPVWRLLPFVAVNGGAMTLLTPDSVVGRDTDPVFGWSAGLKLRLTGPWRLRLDFTHSMTDAQVSGALAHTYALTFGVALSFTTYRSPPAAAAAPPLDSDGDGVIDARDKCPHEAEDPDGFEDDDGCPDPDNDRDGIPDHLDVCPNHKGRRCLGS